MSSLVIKAVDDGGGSAEFILVKEPVEALLHDFFVSEGLCECKQSYEEEKTCSHRNFDQQ